MDDAHISAFPDRFGGSRGDDGADDRSDANRETGSARASAPACRLLPVARREPEPKPPGFGASDTDASDLKANDLKPPDLRPLADQLMAIARQLRDGELGASLASSPARMPSARMTPARQATASAQQIETGAHRHGDSSQPPRPDPAERRRRFGVLARKTYAARRRRAAIFGQADLFGEPAWDILIDLYINHVESKDVSVSSACIGSAAPATTGLRWLGVLAENDLVLREHDPDDQRRVLVRLTERGLEAMDRYFALASGAL